MATRCLIAIEKDNGLNDVIYCHFDGYLSGVGEILFKFYNTPEKVRELIEMGDLSYLGNTLDKQDTCAYHRDRNEDLNVTRNASYLRGIALGSDSEYVYVFRNGEWFFNRIYKNDDDRRLNDIAGLVGYLNG